MRSSRAAALVLSLLAALPLSRLAAQQPASSDSAQAPMPTPAARPFEDVIKLWKANLSEDFVRRQIETGAVIYNLTADDIIRCRDAGLPESLINAMIATSRRTSGTPAGGAGAGGATSPMVPAPAATPVAAMPASTPSFAPQANMRWEGLVRRNSGVVLLKSRWDAGTLEFKEETLRWIDAKDAGKNLLIPARQIKEQFLTCLKKPGGNECFEWGFKTKDGEYRFRDVAWHQDENKKPQEIFDFMKAIYPSLVSSQQPVDGK